MIRVSHIRKEHLPESQEFRLVCDIDCPFSQSKQLWFSVPEQYGDWLTDDVYDAFMVAMLYPAMYYNEDIEIDGCVSEKLYDNITHYVQLCEQAYIGNSLTEVNIKVAGFANTVKAGHLVGTGFSGGIDAFATFYDRFVKESNPHYRISALFFFNVGSHGGGTDKARRKFHTRYDYLLPFAQEVGLPFVPMDSNLFDFYLFEWEYDAGALCRSTGMLVFQKVLDKYYVAYDYSYWEIVHMTAADYASITDMCNDYLLGTETLEVIVDGTRYRRSDKTLLLIDYPPFLRYLNVCVGDTESVKNCSLCHKCKRTMLLLDIMGQLDRYGDLFDVDKFKKVRFSYKCQTVLQTRTDIYAQDNYELAKKLGYPMPSYIVAWLYSSPQLLMKTAKNIAKKLLRRHNPGDNRHYPT